MGLKMTKIPQSIGTPGWIVFTYEKNIPVCLWIGSQECQKIPCCVDERLCGDTIIKVEKIGPLEFLVSDIWLYNSNCVFACSTFKQRQEWLSELLKMFTYNIPGKTAHLIHKSQYTFADTNIRGYEYYSEETIGKQGYFVEKDTSTLVKIRALHIPDCYEIIDKKEYLKVPDLKTSLYLRSKGKEFECRCIQNTDNSWSLVENIPDVE